MSKKEFWKHGAGKPTRTNIIIAFVISMFSAAVTAMLAMVQPIYFLDVALMLGLGFGLFFGKSRACAVILAVYFLISKIMQFSSGVNAALVVSSLLYLCGYIAGIIGTFSFRREYQAYLAAGGSGGAAYGYALPVNNAQNYGQDNGQYSGAQAPRGNYCPYCGAANEPQAKYCGTCGKPL